MSLTTLHSGPDQTDAQTLEGFFGGIGVKPRDLEDKFDPSKPAVEDREFVPNLALPQLRLLSRRDAVAAMMLIGRGNSILKDEIVGDFGQLEAGREEVRAKIAQLFMASIKAIPFPLDGQSIVRPYEKGSAVEEERFVNEEELEVAAGLISGALDSKDPHFNNAVANYRLGMLPVLTKLVDMVRTNGNPRHTLWHLEKLMEPYVVEYEGKEIKIPLTSIPWDEEDEMPAMEVEAPDGKKDSRKKVVVPFRSIILDGGLKKIEKEDFDVKNHMMMQFIMNRFALADNPVRKFIDDFCGALDKCRIDGYRTSRWIFHCLSALLRIQVCTSAMAVALRNCANNFRDAKSEEDIVAALRPFIEVDLPRALSVKTLAPLKKDN